MRVATIDSGKFHTCGVGDDEKIELMFKTRVDKIEKYDPDIERVLEYQNGLYAIGEDDGFYDTTPSKLTMNHKLATLYAIPKLLPDLAENEHIILAICMPILMHNDPVHKKDFKDFFIGEHEVVINNKRKYTFRIADVLILPESAGIVHNSPELFKDKIVGVIDWGGLQSNNMIYENGRRIKTTGTTKSLGGYSLETEIINTLNSTGTCNYQDYEIPSILKSTDPDVKPIVDKLVNLQIERILAECRKKNWNIGKLDLLWTGGSSKRFKDYLEKRGYTVSKDAFMDNARGSRKVAKAWVLKRQKTQTI